MYTEKYAFQISRTFFYFQLPQDSIAGILVGICLPNSCKGSEIKYLIESGKKYNISERVT